MEFTGWITLLAPVATATGVCVGALSLVNSKRQAVTTFEDALSNEYRQITTTLPTAALLGESLSTEILQAHLPDFYRYFDLTNGQIFLRKIGRISKKTWIFWCEGIRTNLSRPAFSTSWEHIASRSNGDFSELRKLIVEEFKIDPKNWAKNE